MNPELIIFVKELCEVVERHKGGISYTVDDDGIHLSVGKYGKSICIGFIENGDTSEIKKQLK